MAVGYYSLNRTCTHHLRIISSLIIETLLNYEFINDNTYTFEYEIEYLKHMSMYLM